MSPVDQEPMLNIAHAQLGNRSHPPMRVLKDRLAPVLPRRRLRQALNHYRLLVALEFYLVQELRHLASRQPSHQQQCLSLKPVDRSYR